MLAVVRVLGIVLMAALSLIGPGMVFYGLRQRSKVLASQNWARVTGKVAGAKIEQDSDGTEFQVAVEYDYAVNGVLYRGKRLRFCGWYKTRALLQAELERYRPGYEVAVFYDPEKPSEAVLERSAEGTLWWILLGILMIVMSVAGAFAMASGNTDTPLPN